MDSDQAVVVAQASSDLDAALPILIFLLQVIGIGVAFVAGAFTWRLVVLSKNQRQFWSVVAAVLVIGGSASADTFTVTGNTTSVVVEWAFSAGVGSGSYQAIKVFFSAPSSGVSSAWTWSILNAANEFPRSGGSAFTLAALKAAMISVQGSSDGNALYSRCAAGTDAGSVDFFADWGATGTAWGGYLIGVSTGAAAAADSNWQTYYDAIDGWSVPVVSCLVGQSAPSGWANPFYSTLISRCGSFQFAWSVSQGVFYEVNGGVPRYFFVPVTAQGSAGYDWYFVWCNQSGSKYPVGFDLGTGTSMSAVMTAYRALSSANLAFECYSSLGAVQTGPPNGLGSVLAVSYNGAPATFTWNATKFRFEGSVGGINLQWYFPAGSTTATLAGWYMYSGSAVYVWP